MVFSASAVYLRVYGCQQVVEIDAKRRLPIFLRLETRPRCYRLNAEVRWLHSKKSSLALLTCIASERSWNRKTADEIRASVEQKLKDLCSSEQDFVQRVARDAKRDVMCVGSTNEDVDTQDTRNLPEIDSREQNTNAKNGNLKEQQVTIPSNAFAADTSSRLVTTTRFAFLLALVVLVFGAVSVTGIFFAKWWKELRERVTLGNEAKVEGKYRLATAEAPSAFSFFMKKDVKRKETVEWVNMVIGKLWKVYRRGLETWLIELLQPLIDNLKKPSYVRRVEIKYFNLGDEPLSVRSVERRTSRQANDLQYHIGLRYTGEARMLLWISLSAGFVPVVIPVGVRGLDLDGEVWVKLRLIPSEPWVGTATWAFVSLPKIILALTPFSLFNIMGIPFLSRFLTKLLTVDLPQLFVRPNKIVIDFGKNQAPNGAEDASGGLNIDNNHNKDFAGELSVTLVDARKLNYFRLGKTDPYVILTLGDQIVRSKKNSQTTIIGPPGAPIWNQDFQLLVVDPKREKLAVRVRDTVGFTVLTVGYGKVDLSSLQDTVPVDQIVPLKSSGWGPRRFGGEIMLRLTYKAYVEDEDEDDTPLVSQLSDSDNEKGDDFLARKEYRKRRRATFLNNLFTAVNTAVKNLGYGNVKVTVKPKDDVALPNLDAEKTEDERGAEANVDAKDAESVESKGGDADPVAQKGPPLPVSQEKAKPQGRGLQSLTENSAVLWLGLATGIALLAAVSLNFSNLVNP